MASVQPAEEFVILRLKSWVFLYTEVLHIYFQSSADRLYVAENQ